MHTKITSRITGIPEEVFIDVSKLISAKDMKNIPGVVCEGCSDHNEHSPDNERLHPCGIVVSFVRDVCDEETENSSGENLVN
jgi:hypothetical protein